MALDYQTDNLPHEGRPARATGTVGKYLFFWWFTDTITHIVFGPQIALWTGKIGCRIYV